MGGRHAAPAAVRGRRRGVVARLLLVGGACVVVVSAAVIALGLVSDVRTDAEEQRRADAFVRAVAAEQTRRDEHERDAMEVTRSLASTGRSTADRVLLLADCPSTVPQPSGPNGQLPSAALCLLPAGFELRADAAEAWALLEEDFRAAFGRGPCVNNGYRSYDQQASMYAANPGLVAAPGTSNHGLGLAVDLCGDEEGPGSPTWDWLDAHGGTYGWGLPSWARPGGSRAEPWHFEYLAAGGDRVQ